MVLILARWSKDYHHDFWYRYLLDFSLSVHFHLIFYAEGPYRRKGYFHHPCYRTVGHQVFLLRLSTTRTETHQSNDPFLFIIKHAILPHNTKLSKLKALGKLFKLFSITHTSFIPQYPKTRGRYYLFKNLGAITGRVTPNRLFFCQLGEQLSSLSRRLVQQTQTSLESWDFALSHLFVRFCGRTLTSPGQINLCGKKNACRCTCRWLGRWTFQTKKTKKILYLNYS